MGFLLSLQCLLLIFSVLDPTFQLKNSRSSINNLLVNNLPLFITNNTSTANGKFQHLAFWINKPKQNHTIYDVKIGDNLFKFGISLSCPKNVIKKSLMANSSEYDGYVTINGDTKFIKINPSENVQGDFDGILALDFIKTFNTLFISPKGEVQFNLPIDHSKNIAIPLDENFQLTIKDSNEKSFLAALCTNTCDSGEESVTVGALKTTNDWIYLNAKRSGFTTLDSEIVKLDAFKFASSGFYIDVDNLILYIPLDDEIFKPTSVEEAAATIKIALESGKTSFKEVKQSLTSKGIPIFNCKTPDDIILLAAKLKVWGEKKLLESIEESFDTLPENTPNCGASTVSAYRSESQLLRRAVKTNPSLLDYIIAELDFRGVDYKDCKTPESYADRLAYSRVFSNSKKKRAGKFKKSNAPTWNVSRKQIPGGIAQLFSNDGDFGIKFEFSDSGNLPNPGGMSGLFGDGIVESIIKQFMGESPFSTFQSTGFNPFTFDQESLNNYDYDSNSDDLSYDSTDNEDVNGDGNQIDKPLTEELQKLYDKAGDKDLQNLIEKANQDDELRGVLEEVSKNGFDSVQKSSLSKTALYLLQKLKDAKLI